MFYSSKFDSMKTHLWIKPLSGLFPHRTLDQKGVCTPGPHDDVIKWKHFRAFLALCAGNSLVPGKASDAELWRFLWSLPWINGWVNNRKAGDLRRHRAHYDVIVMNWESWQRPITTSFARNCTHSMFQICVQFGSVVVVVILSVHSTFT